MKIKIGRFQWDPRHEHRRLAALTVLALVALIAGVTAVMNIVYLPAPTPRAPAGEPGALKLAYTGDNRNRLLDEEARLLDPAPLFLPTQYNFTQAETGKITRREPDQAFHSYPASFAYPDDTFAVRFSDALKIPENPVDALDYGHTQTPYANLGRVEQNEKPLAPRQAHLEVVQIKTGQTLLGLSIPYPDSPAAELPEALVIGDWRPLEYLVAIDVAGVASPPTLMKGAAAPALVQYFANHLGRTLHLGARRELPPGIYILRVGP